MQHYVIKFVSDLRHVGEFLRVLRFLHQYKTFLHNITEILLKVALITIKPLHTVVNIYIIPTLIIYEFYLI